MNDFIAPISQVGFPIVVSLLLLVRIEKKMDILADKMEKMMQKLDENTVATGKLSTLIDERLVRRS